MCRSHIRTKTQHIKTISGGMLFFDEGGSGLPSCYPQFFLQRIRESLKGSLEIKSSGCTAASAVLDAMSVTIVRILLHLCRQSSIPKSAQRLPVSVSKTSRALDYRGSHLGVRHSWLVSRSKLNVSYKEFTAEAEVCPLWWYFYIGRRMLILRQGVM